MGLLFKKVFLWFGILTLFLFLSTFKIADAKKITFVSKLDLSGQFIDNIDFSRVDPREDFFVSIKPSFLFSGATEKLNLNAKALFNLKRYAQESDEDRENQEYGIGCRFPACALARG